MAPSIEDDIVAWAKEVRGSEQLSADPAGLEEIRAFLASHEAESVRSATHVVLENYPDWWAKGRRAPPGLEVAHREDIEALHRHAGTLFSLGIPLTLAERRTPLFRFFQDLEAWGTRDACMSAEELIGPGTPLTGLIGAVMGEVFPSPNAFLDAALYDATGLSQTKGVRKTSLRLVWPGILVDSDRAARIRDLIVTKLQAAAADEGPIAELEGRLRELNQANAWHSVFGDVAYANRSNVRMPLCDRVSPLPLRAPEHRPLAAVGVLRFNFGAEGKLKMEWLCRQAELEGSEWIKIGSIRQGGDQALTEWTLPSWSPNQPIPPSSTRTGRVKVRTAGGSDGGGGLRLKTTKVTAPPERAGQLMTVERKFIGEPDLFCEKMEQHMGKAAVEADGAFVWRQPGAESRIIMYAEDKRVKVVGKPNQVRSLVVIVAPFTEAQTGLGPFGRQPGPGLLADGRPPSAAYAPPLTGDVIKDSVGSAERTDGVTPASDIAEGNKNTGVAHEGVSICGQTRVANEPFEPQGQGELCLSEGDSISVTHDPEGGRGSGPDRWVYGRNQATGQCGWFPLSHTVALEEE